MKKTIEKVPAEALKFHFGDEASACEFADAGDDGKVPIKIKARSREPIAHWYWGRVIHDMSGMRTNKKRVPLDYCHREDEILGALDTFDTEAGDLQTAGFLDAEDERAAEIVRKGKKGVPYEASIFFDRRTVEAERLGERESATVNGVTVRGPVTIIRKWTLRGVAVCPYGYDPKTSTRFSDNGGDVDVTLLSHDPDEGGSTMPVDQQNQDPGQLSEKGGADPQPEGHENPVQLVGMFGRLLGRMVKFSQSSEDTPADPPPKPTELSDTPAEKPADEPGEKPGKLSTGEGEGAPANPPEASTELGAGSEPEAPAEKKAPGQVFIDRFGLEQGAVYFAQGLSMEEATFQHNKTLEKKVDELTARIEGANLGSEAPVTFSGATSKSNGKEEKASGDDALDAFCANTNLPGQRS